MAAYVGSPVLFLEPVCRAVQTSCPGRHHIPKPRYRVNWSEYDPGLKRRGSLTVWFTDEAVATLQVEPRTTPGGQAHYSPTGDYDGALALRAVFGLAFGQTEGL